MRTRNHDIASTKQAHRIEDVIRACGVTLSAQRERGERLQAHCPFPGHQDSTPSFMVYPQTQTFRCFGCGVGGDVFDFLQHSHGWSFVQAFQYLTGSPGITPSYSTPPHFQTTVSSLPQHTHRPHDLHSQFPDHRPVLTLAIQLYQEELFRHPNVLAYVGERAVSLETTRYLCLGYSNGQTLHTPLRDDPLLSTEASAAGLLTSHGSERLACRLVIPEMRAQQALYLIGRIVPPSRSRHKYLGIATKKRLLGYGEAMRQITQQQVEGMLIVEGALDFVLAWQWQLPVCCVALLSTWASQLQLDEVGELYEHIKGTPVFVFLDADTSGAKSTPTLLSQLERRGLPAISLPPLEEVKDIGELGKLPDGRERLLHRLMEAMTNWRGQSTAQ